MRASRTFVFALVLASACDAGQPTNAVVDNAYPAAPDGDAAPGAITVYRGWWQVTLFPEPVAPGGTSPTQRAVEGTDVAYFALAPGWDPASATAPTRLLPAMTKVPVTAGQGDTLRIVVDDDHVAGNCAAGQPLAQEDADFIMQRIFPGPFAGMAYDAATCTMRAAAGGGDAAGGADAAGPD